MRRIKAVASLSLFILLPILITMFAFAIQPVRASGSIHIRADGKVEGTDKIQREGDVYTFTDNINDSIVKVERSNVIIDGDGYTLQGSGSDNGFYLFGINNVTIKNTNIKGFQVGVALDSTSYNVISGNNITANSLHGVYLWHSSSNSISGNNITNNHYGISLYYSSNNTLSGNTITNGYGGISAIHSSSYNSIWGNTVTNSSDHGIAVAYSSYNSIWGNTVTNSSDHGIGVNDAFNNEIYHNNLIGNARGVRTGMFSINIWDDGYSLGGNYWSDYTGVDSNADGIGDTPYIIDLNNQDRYPTMNICKPWTPTYISIVTNSPSTIVGFAVNITGTLSDTYGNRLKNKTVVLHYTFPGADSEVPITSDITDNLGHYSAEWIPPATGYFTIKAEWAGNTTHYTASDSIALTTIPHENRYVFSVESNSTISALAFNTTGQELSFTASGPSGTGGYVRVTIAKTLVENIADVKVYLDGDQINYTITSIDDSWLLHFTYRHSTHTIAISLGPAPFIPPQLITPLSLGILAVALAVATAILIFKIRRGTPPTILNGVFRKSKPMEKYNSTHLVSK